MCLQQQRDKAGAEISQLFQFTNSCLFRWLPGRGGVFDKVSPSGSEYAEVVH